MKNKIIKISILYLFVVLFFSCSYNDLNLNQDGTKPLKLTGITGIRSSMNGDILYFDSDSIFMSTLNSFSEMSNAERDDFLSKIKFNGSLVNILVEAEKELDMIAEISDSISFMQAYKAYRNKYSENFIFDEIKEDADLSPQLRVKNFIIANFANKKGDIFIGGKLINLNQNEVYEDIYPQKKSILETRAVVEQSSEFNFIEMRTSSRKLRVYVGRNNKEIELTFSSQAKVWYGWKNNNSTYEAIFSLDTSLCTPRYKNTNESQEIIFRSFGDYLALLKSPSTNHYTVSVADIKANVVGTIPIVFGSIYVTSSGVNNWGRISVRL